jgi:hypothetical protein
MNTTDRIESNESVQPDGKKKKRTLLLLWGVILFVLLILLPVGSFCKALYTFTEKREPFPPMELPDTMQQLRLMMKVRGAIRNAAENSSGLPEKISILFTPGEVQAFVKILSSFGTAEKDWGKFSLRIAYLPEKMSFRGNGIFHIEKPFLRNRQIPAETVFKLKIAAGKPEIEIISLKVGKASLKGPFPGQEKKLKAKIMEALEKKKMNGVIETFEIRGDGKGLLILSVKKLLSGPGKMLLYM